MARKTFSIAALVLILAAVSGESLAQLADSAWPCEHQNLQRTSMSPYTRNDTPEVLWTFRASDEVFGTPIVGIDNVVYFVAPMLLYAVNPDGSARWSYELLADADAGPVQDQDGTIYLSASNGEIYFFNADGTLRWHQNVAANSSFAPTIGPDGTIYFGTQDYLMALNKDHSLEWHFRGNLAQYSDFEAAPAITPDGTIYVTCKRDGWQTALIALSQNGDEVHEPFCAANVTQITPAIGGDGTVYLPVGSYLHALNPDLTQRWRFVTTGLITSTPALTASGDIYISMSDSKVYRISEDGPTGNQWFLPMAGCVTASAVSDGIGCAYIAEPQGVIEAIAPDGSLLWSFPLGAAPSSQMAVGPEGELLVGLVNGSLVCLGSGDSGNERPELDAATVWPARGTVGDTFTFSVDYFDADGDAPRRILVFLDDSPFDMTLKNGTPDNGTYRYETTLGLGEYSHYFTALDAQGAWVRYPAGAHSFQGPIVEDAIEVGPALTLVLEKSTFKARDRLNLYAYAENPSDSPVFVDVYIALQWCDGKTLFFLPYFSTAAEPMVSRLLLGIDAKTPMYTVFSAVLPEMLEANYAWIGAITSYDDPGNLLWFTRECWRFTK
ncbi:MAG: PQQ-like beta-propeller repeat protein [Candidatus Coatesbacteria bacterium]|nr:PQQ-like beta-propeller repeat protein [Candidatus Coatesbacteria bacterium]